MWEGYQLEHTSTPLWLYFSDGTKLQLEDVFSHVIDILFHSLESLSSVLPAADWLLRNTNEGTRVSDITTLSEAFVIDVFTIIITWSWNFNNGESLTRVVPWPSYHMNWCHQILEKKPNNLQLKLGWGLLTLQSMWPPLVFRQACFYIHKIWHSVFLRARER